MTYEKLVILDNIGRSFTAKATGTITGGDLLKWTSGTDNVGSADNTYDWDHVCVDKTDDASNCVGMALTDATSGAAVAVATNGVFILPAGSLGISGGAPVWCAGYGNMVEYETHAYSGCGITDKLIGTAFTKATALTGFAIVKLSI